YGFVGSVLLILVTFADNQASFGGGLCLLGGDANSVNLNSVTFSGNWTDFDNEGQDSGGGMFSFMGSPRLANVTFMNNGASIGGGMANGGSSPTLHQSTFGNNWHDKANSTYSGSGMANLNTAIYQALLQNKLLSIDSDLLIAPSDWALSSNPTLENVTFQEGKFSSGMLNQGGSAPTLTNVTLLGWMENLDSNPLIRNSIQSSHKPIYNYNSVPQIESSLIVGGCPTGATCTNVIDQDPMLDESLHLNPDSPAVGQGLVNCPETDHAGMRRDTPCDLGAYEQLLASAGTTINASVSGVDFSVTAPTYSGISIETLPVRVVTVKTQAPTALKVYDFAGNLPVGFSLLSPSYTPRTAVSGEPTKFTLMLRPSTGNLVLAMFDPDSGEYGFDGFTTLANTTLTSQAMTPGLSAVPQITIATNELNSQFALFTVPNSPYVLYSASGPNGVSNLAGGEVLTYTIELYNSEVLLPGSTVLSTTLPTGLSFGGWLEQGGATITGSTITWTPNAPALGTTTPQRVRFSVQVTSDSAYRGQSIVATAYLAEAGAVTSADSASISRNAPLTTTTDSVTTRPATPVSIEPLANDSNPDNSTLILTTVSTPTNGTASLDGSTVIYTPTAGFEGNDSFIYTVQDGSFEVAGTVEVRVANLAFLQLFQDVSIADRSFTGQVVTYTLRLSNDGLGDAATGVVLTDTLPSGLRFVEWITQAGATLNGSTITWRATTVPTATTVLISFRALITGAAGTSHANTVTVTAANADAQTVARTLVVATPWRTYVPLVRR
ncbi:MAG: Ig-like domain-containing protein, partial [Chloroflexales bacterium]